MKPRHGRPVSRERLKLRNYLEESGRRISRGRQMVFNEVIHTHGHFTAEELAKTCFEKSKVSRVTVYRTLKELLEAGVVRETAFGHKHRHFEHVYDENPHHHAQCVRCHSFIEFPDMNEDKVYRPYLEKQGFQVVGHEMHFYGICRQCRDKEKTG